MFDFQVPTQQGLSDPIELLLQPKHASSTWMGTKDGSIWTSESHII